MTTVRQTLTILPETFAICRFTPGDSLKPWSWAPCSCDVSFVSITKTSYELSIICPESFVPADVAAVQPTAFGWRCLRLEGAFDVDQPGVLASLVGPLAAEGISVFAISTFDTDYLLVRDLASALALLRRAGHRV